MFKTGEEKRNSYNYREKYLKHNPGFFNSFYICSQCFKPISEDELEVDHIFPISKWWAPNHLVNLVAACVECNRKKSNKIKFNIQIKSLIAKLIEEFYILFHKGFVLGTKLIILAISYLLNYLKDLVVKQKNLVLAFVIIIIITFIYNLI